MSDFRCPTCRGRFIGQGSGSGWVRVQCKACGQWYRIRLEPESAHGPVATKVKTG